MVERIVKKFRLQVNDYSEKQKLVSNMFDMCRYEEAWYSNRSVWCSVNNFPSIKFIHKYLISLTTIEFVSLLILCSFLNQMTF